MFISLIAIIVGVLLYNKNKKSLDRMYRDYYEEKRSKFPWLENWAKEYHIDPGKVRADEAIPELIIMVSLAYFGILLIGGWILNGIIRFIAVNSFASNFLPGDIGYIVYRNIGSVIMFVVAMIVSSKLWENNAHSPDSLEPEEGLTLECPSCKCPHSWSLLKRRHVVEKEWQEKKTITTTTTNKTASADSYGGGAIGQGFAGASGGSSTSTKTIITNYYGGKTQRSFKCLNCGKASGITNPETWKDERPNEDETFFDPPRTAWDIGHGKGGRLVKAAIIAVMSVIAIISVANIRTNIAYDAHIKKEEAAKLEKEDTNSSFIARATGNMYVFKSPSSTAEHVGRILKGNPVLLTGEDIVGSIMAPKGEEPAIFLRAVSEEYNGWVIADYVRLPKGYVFKAKMPPTAKTKSPSTLYINPNSANGLFYGLSKNTIVVLTGEEAQGPIQRRDGDEQITYVKVSIGKDIGWTPKDHLIMPKGYKPSAGGQAASTQSVTQPSTNQSSVQAQTETQVQPETQTQAEIQEQTQAETVTAGQFAEGDTVFAEWSANEYYLATITALQSGGRANVNFYDGSNADNVRIGKPDDMVKTHYAEGNSYLSKSGQAEILGISGTQVQVRWNDGNIETVPLENIIFTRER
jgi:hypothetical protein